MQNSGKWCVFKVHVNRENWSPKRVNPERSEFGFIVCAQFVEQTFALTWRRDLAAPPTASWDSATSVETTTAAETPVFATAEGPIVLPPLTSPTKPSAIKSSFASWGWVPGKWTSANSRDVPTGQCAPPHFCTLSRDFFPATTDPHFSEF